MGTIHFEIEAVNAEKKIQQVDFNELLVIGYAGRNIEKTMEHIKELEEQLNVPAPKRIPTIFECSHECLTQAETIKFSGAQTSGEVEYVMVLIEGVLYIGLGSDHTDRGLESVSVPKSKQVCPKPISKTIWPFEELKDHWDQIRLVSYQSVDGKEVMYQDGTLADILPADKILNEINERVGNIQNSIIYSGTVPLINGFVYGDVFKCEMIDDVLKRKIELVYDIDIIPEVER
ncbi:DUF2848 family protein [Fusibacter paucivorans]|uniref:DUF2848 family protein n=1 Tax=Fusibacter paucivorans TaxID=76009 RepID=A0ABS5PJH1_9FIRM|nr:DUF2848 family protein [Fusibacter paucivorans]MBS7525280.1 DUF2848 family protein [Fusibacter paucivorans]